MNGLKLSQLKQVTENTIQFLKCMNIILLLKKVAYNGKRLCDGGEIEAEKLNLLQMFNQGTNVEISTKAPLLQNRCYVPLFSRI